MVDSEPTHDNPRITRNLPAVVQEGEVVRPAADNWLTRAIRTLFGWKPGSVRDDLQVVLDASTPDEVGFSAIERTMLRNILGLHERRIADVMIHRADIIAVHDRDPATHRYLEPLLYYKGFHAIQTYRLAHWLWGKGRRDFALYLQSRSSAVFQCDINPNAKIGRGIFLDHATGFVCGETAEIEDDVSILHDVTLGGTGKENEDRHPKIRRGVMIGAGAKILGNIEVGHCARIAAGSVVIKPVPNNVTVAGVPAKVVGEAGCAEPSRAMDQLFYEAGP